MQLFFVRRNNDIDHIAPIVWALTSRGERAAVLCLDPLYDIAADYRLQFLARECGVRVDYLQRSGATGGARRLAASLLCSDFVRARGRRRNLRQLAAGAYRRLIWPRVQTAAASLYDEAWAARFLQSCGARVLVFDHAPPSRYMISALLNAAARLHIPTVAVPHGTHMLVNELRATSRADTGRFGRTEILARYDWVVTMEPLIAEYFVRTGLSADRVFTLGSARFCDRWRDVLSRIAPAPETPPVEAQGRLRLVYMDKQHRERVHQDRIDAEIARIAARPDVALVIKPETRTNSLSSPALAGRAFIADSIGSIDLIRWADAVLVGHSSIAIEVLLQNKPLLHARYFHDNLAMFDEMGASWVFRDADECHAALDRLVRDRTHRPYSDRAVSRFLAQVIDGGRPGRDVLGDHVEFLTAVAEGRAPADVRPLQDHVC